MVKPAPLWKWTGGKRQLLPELHKVIDPMLESGRITRYAEPFIGGGALMWDLLPAHPFESVYIGDMNAEMLNVYRLIATHPDELATQMKARARTYFDAAEDGRPDVYYAARKRYNDLIDAHPDGDYRGDDALESAGLFLFLGRTCFNGLYRTNRDGHHNVPFGKYKNPAIENPELLAADHELLSSIPDLQIHLGGYEDSLGFADERTLVYLDPPYRPLPGTPSFTSYAKSGFNDDDQEALADYCRKLDAAGAKFVLSNSDPHNTDPDDDFFDDLFEGFAIERVKAKRNINSKGDGRGAVFEILVHN